MNQGVSMDNNDDRASKQASAKQEVYEYKAAGIQETHGHVPLWLWAVVVVMTIWGIAYLFVYWTPSP